MTLPVDPPPDIQATPRNPQADIPVERPSVSIFRKRVHKFRTIKRGYYAFVIGASDGGRLSVAGKTLISIDATSHDKRQIFAVPLRAGVYPVRFEFMHGSKNTQLDFHLLQFKDDEDGWDHEMK